MSEPIYNDQYERMTYIMNDKICHAYKVYEDEEKTAWAMQGSDKIYWQSKV